MNKHRVQRVVVAAIALGLVMIVGACTQENAEVSYKRQSGDLAAFFMKQACAYGARPRTNATIAKVETSWEFAPDKDGFQILMSPSDTERLVQAALVPAFGEPLRRPSYPNIYYRIKDIGVSLIIGTDETSNLNALGTTNNHLVCVRGDTMLKQLGENP